MDNNDSNVYKAPESALENAAELAEEPQYIGPQNRPTGNGLEWISNGFKIFSKSPGAWILTMIVGFIIMIVINMIPIIGGIFGMLTTYVWMAGLIIGCKAVDNGEPMDIKYLFAGFSNNAGKLIGLYLLVMVISFGVMFAVMFAVVGIPFLELVFNGDGQLPNNVDHVGLLLWFLVAMALLIPLMMAVWFAPVLIVLQNMPIIESMKASFWGCYKNMLPFLIYGIILLLLLVVAAIPLFLGMLVLAPVSYASIYCSYKDIYLQQD